MAAANKGAAIEADRENRRKDRDMNFRSRLQNPFLLVGQGFLAGAVLFFALLHGSGEAHSPQPAGADGQIEVIAAQS